MTIITAIRSHEAAQTAAQAGDFTTVATILSNKNISVKIGKAGGKATLSALVVNGIDPNAVIAAMRSVPMASELLDTLTVSGVDWDDDLTKYVMGGLVKAGKITQQVATIVQGLSLQHVSLAGGTVTADDCRSAWESHKLAQQWAMIQNESINPAVGNRVALIAALRKSADTLENS